MSALNQMLLPRCFMLLVMAGFCHASLNDDMDYLYSLSLLELSMLEVNVSIASGNSQKVTDAPAIVSIISAQDIHYWGFQSVAEAINHQPGIYCIDDGLNYNCGLRGVSGGFRGYSKVLKVMINGQAISFRSDSSNFLGQELIPMATIKRIEIIRGPSSALYGANAFLGVINIITGNDILRKNGLVSVNIDQNGQSIAAYYRYQHKNMGGFISLSSAQLDYSGRKIPGNLPRRSLFLSGEETKNDTAFPVSGFIQSYLNTAQHTLTLNAHYSRLDSKANFVDSGRFIETGELGTDTRLSVFNSFIQALDKWKISPVLITEFSLAYANGGPSHKEHLDVGLNNSFVKRDLGYEAIDAGAKVLWQISQNQHFIAGFDHTLDNEKLFNSYTVDSTTLEKTQQGIPQGHKSFINSGLFLQHSANINKQIAITLNTRIDEHNIYGQNGNMRAALIYQLHNNLSTKYLYSTSYKAPAALQLFGQPLFDGEISDNIELKPETAETVEAQINWALKQNISLSLNTYQMKVRNKVEIISEVTHSSPKNQGIQRSAGIEMVANWHKNKNKFNVNWAWQRSESESFDTLANDIIIPSDLYPQKMLNVFWQYQFNNDIDLGLHSRFISARRASSSNIALNGGEAYDLNKYWLLNGVFHYGFKNSNIRIKVSNILDKTYSEPGFSSLDIPGARRNIQLNLNYYY